MRVVRVAVTRQEFPDTLGRMRAWLDQHNRPLVRFETGSEDNLIVLKTYFDDDDLAASFGDAFGGAPSC